MSVIKRAGEIIVAILALPLVLILSAAALLVGLFTALTGWGRTTKRSNEEVAQVIEEFVAGTGGEWDCDDFLSFRITDPRLDEIRERCNRLSAEFPASEVGHYCGPEGFEVLRSLVVELRGKSA